MLLENSQHYSEDWLPNGQNLNLNLNPYLGQSEDERQGPGRGCESERDELRL